MPLASRANVDTAGGLILPIQTFVKIDGAPWAVFGSPIVSHGSSPHDAATMAAGSTFVKIDGVAPCAAGMAATCGHTSTGSGPVTIAS